MSKKLIGIQLILSIFIFDFFAATFARQKVRLLYGNYLKQRAGIGRGYPRYHFHPNLSPYSRYI